MDEHEEAVLEFEQGVLQLASCALDAASRAKRNGLVEEAANAVRRTDHDNDEDGNTDEDDDSSRLCREKLGCGGLGEEAGE